MAARLEALAQYYQQHGFHPEAEELRQRAEEFRRRGMPDEFPRAVLPVDQMGVRFSDKPLTQTSSMTFETEPVAVPQVGEVSLLASPLEKGTVPNLVGITIQGDKLVEDNFSALTQKKGISPIEIHIQEGRATLDLPKGHELICRMQIDGSEKVFEAQLGVFDPKDDLTDRYVTYWNSTDPQDATIYTLLASPKDTTLLSKLSFSFASRPYLPPLS